MFTIRKPARTRSTYEEVPSPGASGQGQARLVQSAASGDPGHYLIIRLMGSVLPLGSPFQNQIGGPDRIRPCAPPSLLGTAERSRLIAERLPTVGREVRLCDALRPPLAPARVEIDTWPPRIAQLALAGQEAARGVEWPKFCRFLPAGVEGVCGSLADGHH